MEWTINSVVHWVSGLVGGVFGLYLILLYLRWREYRALTAILREIRSDLRRIGRKSGVKFPAEKKRVLKR